MMCQTAMRYVQDINSAEDIVQEVFEQLWTKQNDLKSIENVEAYLRRSTSNRSLNFIKKHRKVSFTDDDSSLDSQVIPTPELEVKELGDLITKTIDGLPERCRLIFVMSRYDEMSYKQIAQELDLSVKTIENQISKALKILRIVVENYQKVK